MNWSCDETIAFLERTCGTAEGDFAADGNAREGAAARVHLDDHLAACAACREVRDGLVQTAAALTDAWREPQDAASRADAALASAVLGRLHEEAPATTSPVRPVRRGAILRWARPAVAAVLVVGVAALAARKLRDETTDSGPAYTLAPPPVADYRGTVFRDVTASSSIHAVDHTGEGGAKNWMVETTGHGAVVFDMDGDDDLDVFVPDGNRLGKGERVTGTWRLYRNDGAMRFTDVTRGSGLDVDSWGCAAVAGDLDSDGRTDLYVACFGRNRVFRNLGGGRFEDVSAKSGAAGLDEEWSTAAALGDLDGDGDLDLYVANYADMRKFMQDAQIGRGCSWRSLPVACGPVPLEPQRDRLYMNRGDGTFEDAASKLPPARRYSFQPVIADLDGDGALDVYVAADGQPNVLLHNRGDGAFEDVAFRAGCASDGNSHDQASMGTAAADVDGDGRLDLFVTNFSHEPNCLYRSTGGTGRPAFQDTTAAAGLAATSILTLGWGASFPDLDNDGDPDLVYANGHLYPDVARNVPETSYRQHLAVCMNDGRGVFTEVSANAGTAHTPRVYRGLVAADLDDDGRIDLFATTLNDSAVVLRSEPGSAETQHGAVRFVLRRRDGRTEAAGASLVARVMRPSGGEPLLVRRDLLLGSSFGSGEDPRLHVGLGGGTIESVTVRWPGSAAAEEIPGAAGLEPGIYEIVEGRGRLRRLR